MTSWVPSRHGGEEKLVESVSCCHWLEFVLASKAVRAGQTFLHRLTDVSTVVKHLDNFVWLSLNTSADLEWWYYYSTSWKGVSMMPAVNKANPQVTLTSDASGSWGLWCLCRFRMVPVKWVSHITSSHKAVKKMVPIVIAAAVWAHNEKAKQLGRNVTMQ